MYRKFRADHLFTGHSLLPANMVLITDEEGRVTDLVDAGAAGGGVEYFPGLLTPGFVNAHCHLELSHLKGLIPEHTGLVPFVQQVMAQRNRPEEMMQQAMQDACAEMWQGGIVAVGDICNTAHSIPAKLNSPIRWHNFIEITGFVERNAEKRLADARLIQEAFFKSATSSRVPAITLSPHAPYSVSGRLFDLLDVATAGQLISMHSQETADENLFFEKKQGGFLQLYQQLGIDISHFSPPGKTSLQSTWPHLSQGQSVILVHNTFISQEDIDFVSGSQLSSANCQQPMANDQPVTLNPQPATSAPQPIFCLCPNANLYIENRLPPVALLRKNNVLIVLGTDSYASNWQLSILEEMKTLQQGCSLPLPELLKWATLNGAIALRMSEQLGSFDKGKTPGIVWVDQLEGLQLSAASASRRIL
ncbi:MAG: amidohydrolase family protein [Ferruginibacter sp.]